MGVLLGVAGRAGIEVKEYSVNKVRSILNVGKIVTDFSKTVTDDVLKRIPDVTKRAIGEVMSKKYGLKFKTDDESDACVLLHYYLKENYGGQNE
jgi:hypothetical protein